MLPRTAVCASWSGDAIWIQWRSASGTMEPQRLARRMLADHRYFLQLYRLADGTLWLRSGADQRTVLDAADAAGVFHPIRTWPDELAALPPYRVVPLADGSVAGLPAEESRILLWRPGIARPVSRELPDGFLAHDGTRDHRGRLWVAGSMRSTKLLSSKRRAALAMSQDDGLSWQVSEAARGNLWVAWYSLLAGADTAYRTIDTVGEHLVVTSEVGDIDDPSTCVFVNDGKGHWRSGVLRHDIFRAALAFGDGHLELLSHQGMRVEDIHRWRRSDFVPRIRSALGWVNAPLDADARFEILSADVSPEGQFLLVVSVRSPQESMARIGEATVLLGTEGDEAWFFQRDPGPEIISARFAPGRPQAGPLVDKFESRTPRQ